MYLSKRKLQLRHLEVIEAESGESGSRRGCDLSFFSALALKHVGKAILDRSSRLPSSEMWVQKRERCGPEEPPAGWEQIVSIQRHHQEIRGRKCSR